MAQSMKGATKLLGGMNRNMNLPGLQRIMMEFERENEVMDQRQEMMDDAVDDAMGVDDEEEGEEVMKEVLDEIGVDLSKSVGPLSSLNSFLLQVKGQATLIVSLSYSWVISQRVCKPQLLPIELRRLSVPVVTGTWAVVAAAAQVAMVLGVALALAPGLLTTWMRDSTAFVDKGQAPYLIRDDDGGWCSSDLHAGQKHRHFHICYIS